MPGGLPEWPPGGHLPWTAGRDGRPSSSAGGGNRISYGCINVPVAFYDRHVQTAFAASRMAMVYVLPQTRSLQDQFGPQLLPVGVGGHRAPN